MTEEVRKTYKLYIGGAFPRSESGRSYRPDQAKGGSRNVPRGSRKDLRDAVVAARKGLGDWAGRTAYNRGQILYRLAEVLETRRDSLAGELALGGAQPAAARREVDRAISLCVWYAGLCDKVQTLLGSQNPVSGPFFDFSTVEPTGVIGVLAPERPALLGALALVLPLLAGGNSAVVLCSHASPFAPLALGELLQVSDFPAGVVNLLSGFRDELLPHFASHRDIDGLLVAGGPDAETGRLAADSVKRVRFAELSDKQWGDLRVLQSLLWVEPFVEVKTFWHPVAP